MMIMKCDQLIPAKLTIQAMMAQIKQRLGYRTTKRPIIVSITGNVASGKSTFAHQLKLMLKHNLSNHQVESVSTDSFLYSNQQLRKLQLLHKKGFPESYDYQRILAFNHALAQHETVNLYEYDHTVNDLTSHIQCFSTPDVLILEGLIALRQDLFNEIDYGIFLNVDLIDNFDWYFNRTLNVRALKTTYVQKIIGKIYDNWLNINLVNYLNNVIPLRKHAQIQIYLDHNHHIKT